MGRFRTLLWLSLGAVLIVSLPGSALAIGGAVNVPAKAQARSLTTSATAALDSGLLDRLNLVRVDHGLARLTLNARLSDAALQHTRDMVAKGYFAHDSADGTPFWKRIQAFYPASRFGYWAVGENLLWITGSESARAAMKSWMASPEHRQNILNASWRQIGIAAVTSRHAPGAYRGHAVTVITTDFGVRRSA